MRTVMRTVMLVAVLFTGACAPAGPRAVAAGDQCAYCRMEVSDDRFGAQVVTRAGKAQVFDSIECLASYLATTDSAAVRGIWVHDAERPGEWVEASVAGFVVDGSLRAPMGRIVAFASPAAAAGATTRVGGTTVSWQAVRADSAGISSHARH
jgi:copper chaperone NosL